MMRKLPATYLQLKSEFVLHELTFAQVGRDVGTSVQFVRATLQTFWGRKDLRPRGVIGKAILVRTRELLLEVYSNGHASAAQESPAQVPQTIDESGAASPQR